jgi:hypothetical protein
MLDLFLGERLSRRVERWIDKGRRPEARSSADGQGYLLRHGTRLRALWAALAALFGGFLAFGLWAQRADAIASVWFMLAYVVMFGGAFVLSASMLAAVALTRVRVDQRGVAEPRLAGGRLEIGWPDVTEVRFSALWESFLIRARDGRTLRISAHLDGLGRLREALQQHAAAVAPAAVLMLMPEVPEAL